MADRSARRVLLTVSGTIPPDLEESVRSGRRPRADYVELARRLGADLLDVPAARQHAGRLGRLAERVAGPGAVLALACHRLRRSYDLVFTDGEQVGLPLAALMRLRGGPRPQHFMIIHVMSVRSKVALYRAFGLGRCIDRMVVYATSQKELVERSLGFPADRTVLTPFMVDTAFFSPDAVVATPGRQICSAGLEHRDYRTLLEAVRGLDVRVVIASGSPWSTRPDTVRGEELPENVEVCTLDPVALRQLYADSLFVVMPLDDVEFQAGITTILEGMAMGKAVVCSRTRGQTDAVVDGVTGTYVPPGDPGALRAAIERLLGDPAYAQELGRAARAWVVGHADIERYADGLAAHVDAALRACP